MSLLFAGKVDTVSQYTDHSGHANHGIQPTAANQPTILTGSDSVAINANKGGSCYDFDGTDDYLYLTNNINFGGGMTILGWFRMEDYTDYQQIFSAYNAVSNDRVNIEFHAFGANTLRFGYCNDGVLHFLSFSAIQAGVWNYFGFTYDGGTTVTAYLNHDRLPDGTSGPTSVYVAGVNLGCRQDNVNFFKGQMVGIRIYDNPLSVTKILKQRIMDLVGMVGIMDLVGMVA